MNDCRCGECQEFETCVARRETALLPVRSEPLLDDIRYAFKHKGWADHMLDDTHLLDTVRDALDLYCKMRATLVGMVELWKGLTSNH